MLNMEILKFYTDGREIESLFSVCYRNIIYIFSNEYEWQVN